MHLEGYRVKPTSGEYDPTGLRELGSDPSKFDQETLDFIREFVNRAKRGSTKPTSKYKKRVKEGSRKFIGPRQLKSEIREDLGTRDRQGGVVFFDNDGSPEPRWLEGKEYASIQPNKRSSPFERALRRTKRRQVDLVRENDVNGINFYIPENLRRLIKEKIKGRAFQDRMFAVLDRALRKRGGKPSTKDSDRDYNNARKRGQTDLPF